MRPWSSRITAPPGRGPPGEPRTQGTTRVPDPAGRSPSDRCRDTATAASAVRADRGRSDCRAAFGRRPFRVDTDPGRPRDRPDRSHTDGYHRRRRRWGSRRAPSSTRARPAGGSDSGQRPRTGGHPAPTSLTIGSSGQPDNPPRRVPTRRTVPSHNGIRPRPRTFLAVVPAGRGAVGPAVGPRCGPDPSGAPRAHRDIASPGPQHAAEQPDHLEPGIGCGACPGDRCTARRGRPHRSRRTAPPRGRSTRAAPTARDGERCGQRRAREIAATSCADTAGPSQYRNHRSHRRATDAGADGAGSERARQRHASTCERWRRCDAARRARRVATLVRRGPELNRTACHDL